MSPSGKSWRLPLRIALLGGLSGVLASPAWAAGGDLSESWLGLPRWAWAWGNLIVFWGLLVYFAGPHVRGFFVRRRQRIAEEMALARRQRAEAEEMRASLESQIAGLRDEVDELARRSVAEGERERERILEQAEQERERIVTQTASELEHRVAQARAELTKLTASLAADLARERARSEITPEDRRRIFERNLQRLKERAS